MMPTYCTILLTTLVLLISHCNEGAIISQSSIRDCSWGDTSEPTSPGGSTCNKKMLISMVIGSGQGNTESLHANVDKAHEEGNKEMSVLKKPFRIELRKTAVVASYRAYLVGSANALPKETAISKKLCVDDFYAPPKKLPCGMQYDDLKRPVWDSQGFCCRCDKFESGHNKRGGHGCGFGNVLQRRGSAHCMKMNDLWYDIFTLEMPMMQYRITLDVFELQGITVNNGTGAKSVNWTLVSTFHLSPSRTIGRSKSGRVIAEVQGSLLGSKAVKDLSTKMLLIPSVRMWPKKNPYPPAYTNGPNDWMLVDRSLVQLLGTECNKIGVQYTGFRRQPGRCKTQKGFCFHNQPLQLWHFDNELRKQKKSGRYMIHNYGKVHHGSHPNNNSFILKFLHEDLHNSFVTLRIDASDIAFVRSTSSGRIVETYTIPFTATVGYGTLTVEVGNTGEVTSDYSVSVVKCSSGLYEIAAKSLSLEPGMVKNTTFNLRSGDTDGGAKECEVQLFDSNFNLLDMAKINFKVGAACLCFGICGCVCDDDKKGAADCSLAGPPTIYKPGPIALTIFVMLLESIGAHGFIGFFGSILLILGFIKLSFGGILCCRKTKAQKYTQKMIEKGIPPKSPLLVQCSGECRGAKAAKARYLRKVKRLRAAGKSPHRLDDWRNTSFECHCKTELTDIRMIHVVRAVCFFYFCCLLPFISIGRCMVWRVFKDTEEKKAKAEQAVLLRAKKKGNMEKYGVVDLATELKKFEGSEKAEAGKKDAGESEVTQALTMNLCYTSTEGKAKEDTKGNAKHTTTKGHLKRVPKAKQTGGTEKDRKLNMRGQRQPLGGNEPKRPKAKYTGIKPTERDRKLNMRDQRQPLVVEHDRQPKMRGREKQGGGFEHDFYEQSTSSKPRKRVGREARGERAYKNERGPRREARVERRGASGRERRGGYARKSRGREDRCKGKGISVKTGRHKSGHRKKSQSSMSSKSEGHHSSKADLSNSEAHPHDSANERTEPQATFKSNASEHSSHSVHSGGSEAISHSCTDKPGISAHESSHTSHGSGPPGTHSSHSELGHSGSHPSEILHNTAPDNSQHESSSSHIAHDPHSSKSVSDQSQRDYSAPEQSQRSHNSSLSRHSGNVHSSHSGSVQSTKSHESSHASHGSGTPVPSQGSHSGSSVSHSSYDLSGPSHDASHTTQHSSDPHHATISSHSASHTSISGSQSSEFSSNPISSEATSGSSTTNNDSHRSTSHSTHSSTSEHSNHSGSNHSETRGTITSDTSEGTHSHSGGSSVEVSEYTDSEEESDSYTSSEDEGTESEEDSESESSPASEESSEFDDSSEHTSRHDTTSGNHSSQHSQL